LCRGRNSDDKFRLEPQGIDGYDYNSLILFSTHLLYKSLMHNPSKYNFFISTELKSSEISSSLDVLASLLRKK